jgi:chaperonin GroEL (HSP60 family)
LDENFLRLATPFLVATLLHIWFLIKQGVIDPTKIVRTPLLEAASITGLLVPQ